MAHPRVDTSELLKTHHPSGSLLGVRSGVAFDGLVATFTAYAAIRTDPRTPGLKFPQRRSILDNIGPGGSPH